MRWRGGRRCGQYGFFFKLRNMDLKELYKQHYNSDASHSGLLSSLRISISPPPLFLGLMTQTQLRKHFEPVICGLCDLCGLNQMSMRASCKLCQCLRWACTCICPLLFWEKPPLPQPTHAQTSLPQWLQEAPPPSAARGSDCALHLCGLLGDVLTPAGKPGKGPVSPLYPDGTWM